MVKEICKWAKLRDYNWRRWKEGENILRWPQEMGRRRRWLPEIEKQTASVW